MNKRVHVDTSQGLEDAVTGQKIIRVDMRAEYEKVEGRVASHINEIKIPLARLGVSTE